MSKLAYLAILLFLFSCMGSGTTPIQKIEGQLKNIAEYSVVLSDMQEEGNFLASYYHRYKIIVFKDSIPHSRQTDWLKVSEPYYKKYEAYLNMVVLSKSPQHGVMDKVSPPGYQYVGNEKYGQWKTGEDGSSFWVWYGKYAMMRSIFGWGNYHLNRNDYNSWRKNPSRPYMGSNNAWGTQGSVTKNVNKSFFQRKKMRMNNSRSGFLSKFNSRVGRTRSSFRSRSSGFGK